MNRRIWKTALIGFVTIILLNWSCTKLDTTNLGSDLLPLVDNVNTFADSIDVLAYQGLFSDSTKINKTDDLVLGKITTDLDFGKTQASVYVQLKPARFPFSIAPVGDTIIGFDSVVLCLRFKDAWGDTSVPQQITVREIPSNTGGTWDSLFQSKFITFSPIPDNSGQLVLYNNAPYQLVDIRRINDKIIFANGKDSVSGQIRIRLSDEYATKLFNQDTAAVTRPGYLGNAFYKDSIFRSIFKGLAIESLSGDALMSINLADANTRIEIHYRKKSNNVTDTTYTSLNLFTEDFGAIFPSAIANKVIRDYSNVPFLPIPVPRVPADEIYLQTTPGTFTDLSLPGLNSFKDTNRIIHRAQLRIIQIPNPDIISDKKFTVPDFLYLDLKDITNAVDYKPVYFDLNPGLFYNPDNIPVNSYYPGEVQYGYFGGFAKLMTDPLTGRGINFYDFNITRYIQQMVTKHNINYDLRVFAPFRFNYRQYSPQVFGYPNNLAHGRVKVGGTNGNYKMQLVIIWSKIKVL